MDVNDERFLTPDSMVEEVRTACWETMQQVPKTIGEIATVIYNSLTAKYTKKKIYAGPTEATALGNISVQMIAAGEFADLKETRKCIFDSFEIKLYEA